MKEEITATKLEEPKSVTQRHELKVPTLITDDYGNEITYFRREVVDVDSLLYEKGQLEVKLSEVNSKLASIEKTGVDIAASQVEEVKA